MSKYFLEVKERLMKDYGIDVVQDILLDSHNKIIAYADISDKSNVEITIISGSFSQIGLENKKMYNLFEIMNFFDANSSYGDIAGRKEFRDYVENALLTFNSQVTFPIRVANSKVWVKVDAFLIEKTPQVCTFFISNITDIMLNEEENYAKTHRDPLTNLFNKYTLDYHYGLRYKRDNLHVLYCDIDNFKRINDTNGHKAGDAILVAFASILKSYESEYNKFYRIGGDEFVGLFFVKPEEAESLATSIVKNTNQMVSKHTKLRISVSIGVVQADLRDDVIRKADKILYKAKNSGKNQYLYEFERNIK